MDHESECMNCGNTFTMKDCPMHCRKCGGWICSACLTEHEAGTQICSNCHYEEDFKLDEVRKLTDLLRNGEIDGYEWGRRVVKIAAKEFNVSEDLARLALCVVVKEWAHEKDILPIDDIEPRRSWYDRSET